MKKVVRLKGKGSMEPTPYLRQVFRKMKAFGFVPFGSLAVDLACGNGRNSEFLFRSGLYTRSYDMKPDYTGADRWEAGERLPYCGDGDADVVLCQYMLMFLSDAERQAVGAEINRIATWKTVLIVEQQKVDGGTMIDMREYGLLLNGMRILASQPMRWGWVQMAQNRMTLQLKPEEEM